MDLQFVSLKFVPIGSFLMMRWVTMMVLSVITLNFASNTVVLATNWALNLNLLPWTCVVVVVQPQIVI